MDAWMAKYLRKQAASVSIMFLSCFSLIKTHVKQYPLVTAGPISSAVMTVYGAKAAVISGTLLSAIGIICSAYAPNIWTLYVTIGIITGKCIQF